MKGQMADTEGQEMNGIETHDMKDTKNKEKAKNEQG